MTLRLGRAATAGPAQPLAVRLLGERFLGLPLLFLVLLAVLWLYNDRVTMEPRRSYASGARLALLHTLAGPVLPVYGQCANSRNLTDGLYARRSDLPGGYCYHSDCSVAASPVPLAEHRFSLRVRR